MKRIIALVVAATFCVVMAGPLFAMGQEDVSNGLQVEEGVLPTGFPYRIAAPGSWNGIVIVDLDAARSAKSKFALYLLDHGYAYIGTGRHPERMTKHDPLTELDAQIAVIKMFVKKHGEPKYCIQYGGSGGGFISLAMAEMYPNFIDGAIAFNARGTGAMAVANTWLDLPFILKALLAPKTDLLVAPVPNDALPIAYDAWVKVMNEAQKTPQGRARIALAVATAQWPTWGSIGYLPEKPEGNLESLQLAMFRSASDGLSNSINRRQLYDNVAGLASWNTGIDYREFYEKGADQEQKKIVQELYNLAGLDLDEDLNRINAQERISGSEGGINYWLKPGRLLSGEIKVPVLHIHGLGDALLPLHLAEGYSTAVKSQGKNSIYRQAFIDAAGHCVQNTAEIMAAIETMVQRLENGVWGDTSAEGLNKLARELNLEEPRFVDYKFTTHFNRFFLASSDHPF